MSGKGRLFAIVWILFGLVIIALTMAMLTTALTAVAVKEEYKLYGTKVSSRKVALSFLLQRRSDHLMFTKSGISKSVFPYLESVIYIFSL